MTLPPFPRRPPLQLATDRRTPSVTILITGEGKRAMEKISFSPFLTGKFETTHCSATWKASQATTEKNTKLQEPLVPKTVQVGQRTIKTLDINLLLLWQSQDSKVTMQLSGSSAAACKTRGSGSVLHLSSQVIFNRQEMIFNRTKESLSVHNVFSFPQWWNVFDVLDFPLYSRAEPPLLEETEQLDPNLLVIRTIFWIQT